MITQFKIFESEKKFPEFWDYVLCDISDYTMNEKLINFVNSNIGQISNLALSKTKDKEQMIYYVRYKNIPVSVEDRFSHDGVRVFGLSDIIFFGKTKEEVEIKIQTRKYNL